MPAIKNTGRSGCLPACDLATGKSMCFWQPLLPLFLTVSATKKTAIVQFMVWAPWALGSGQDVLGSRVYWAPEITGLPGLPNRNLLSVFEVFSPLRQFFKFRICTKNVGRDCLHNASLKCW